MASKKAAIHAIKFAQAIDSNVKNKATWEDVWNTIIDYSGLEVSIHTNSHTRGDDTKVVLDGGKIHKEYEFKNKEVFNEDRGEWLMDNIIQRVIEDVIKNKLVKKPRKKSK